MTIKEQLEYQQRLTSVLTQGKKARVKHTGQIVELKRVSEHGVSMVSFSSGDDCFMSNRYLEPLVVLH